MAIVSFQNYTFQYASHCEEAVAFPNGEALSHVDFSCESGQIVVICGVSGSGKTTLLKSIKDEIAPVGRTSGCLHKTVDSCDIAMVFQNPETQLVTGSVIGDLAFQMENLGFDPMDMHKRMAETVGFFGIEHLLHKNASQLSGGQKQLVALCGALMTRPKLLLLDEPVAQLDPIAAKDFLDTVARINQEFGVTVIMTQHRLDDSMVMADRLALMEGGRVAYFGTPKDVVRQIWDARDASHSGFIPSIPKLSLTLSDEIAFTPKNFRDIAYPFNKAKKYPEVSKVHQDKLVAFKNLLYAYDDSDFVLKNLDLEVRQGEFLCLLGGNGSGKTTLLKILAGILKPYMGSAKTRAKKLGYMPQNPAAFFVADRVSKELDSSDGDYFDKIVARLDIGNLLDRHPYDLSGGEQQKVVLASILLARPELLILDEPVRGLDPIAKTAVKELLQQSGSTVVVSTHDLEFAAQSADRCAMLFDGDVCILSHPRAFFSENRYYTTPVNRAVGHQLSGAILYEDVLYQWELPKPCFIRD